MIEKSIVQTGVKSVTLMIGNPITGSPFGYGRIEPGNPTMMFQPLVPRPPTQADVRDAYITNMVFDMEKKFNVKISWSFA